MAFRQNQQRSSRRGHGVGHGAPSHEYYHMTYTQGPLDGSNTSESFMEQHVFTEGQTVDPRNLTLDQVAPGGSGFTQDFGNLAGDHFPPEFNPSAHPEAYPSGSSTYINSSYPDFSLAGSGESA